MPRSSLSRPMSATSLPRARPRSRPPTRPPTRLLPQVQAAPPPPPPQGPSEDELFLREVRDAYFDYDKADIRPDARVALSTTADFLKRHPSIKATIEGHCDERGSTEYNLGLGVRRATAVMQYLVSLGVSADRLNIVSFGKEKPFCNEHNEACWQQ